MTKSHETTSLSFVQEGIYDKFVAALKDAFENVKVGLPWEDGIQMGAQVNNRQLKNILDYVKIGQDEGAKLVYWRKETFLQ
ncbi:MAG: aldehyde dehydrogenase family protein [Sporolactobacillus sp.]